MRIFFTRYLMTLLCMLASGTWLLPAGMIVIPARRADASPLVAPDTGSSEAAETATKFERSKVGQAWSSVTGLSATSSLALIHHTQGAGLHVAEIHSLFEAENLDAALNQSQLTRVVAWEEESSVTLFRLNAETSPEAAVGSAGYIDVRLGVGTLYSVAAATSRVFTVLMLDAYLPEADQGQTQFRGTRLVPIDTQKSIETALQTIDVASGLLEEFSFTPVESGEFVATRSGSAGGAGGLFCVNNDWVGSNGVQCCANYAIYKEMLAGCFAKFLSGVAACIGNVFLRAGAVVLACAAGCAGAAKFAGPGALKVFMVCLVLCGVIGSVGNCAAGLLCIGERLFDLHACESDAKIQYMKALRDGSCWPAPEGYEP